MEFAAEPHHLEIGKQMKPQKACREMSQAAPTWLINSHTTHLLNHVANVAFIIRCPGELAAVYLSDQSPVVDLHSEEWW